jgi:2-dehydropantoate 2-reductase
LQILIIGAGAIGSLVGAKLAQGGEAVTLVGRPHFAERVRRQGITLHDAGGVQTIHTIQVTGSVAEAFAAPATRYDFAMLMVKSYDTQTVIDELLAAHSDLPVIVSLQNGVGNEEALAAVLGAHRVVAGVITTPVSVTGPGVIQIERPSLRIGLSPWRAGTLAAPVAALAAALQRAGFMVKLADQAAGLKWTKLLMNIMANASCAILDESPAELFVDPALVDLEVAAWREALAVMARSAIQPVNLGGYPFRLLAPLIRTLPNGWLRPILRRQVAGARGQKLPSLHLDLHSGKGRSEVSWLNGAVVQQGQQVGMATPVNQALTETLLSLVADPAACNEWRHNHARLLGTVERRT